MRWDKRGIRIMRVSKAKTLNRTSGKPMNFM
jgi:hypothetical protein